MTVLATGLNIGWSSVTVTPNGGSAIVITNITNVEVIKSSTKVPFYGDTAIFAKMIGNRKKKRGLKITSGDLAKLASIPDDTPCTVVAVNNDAANGSSTGAITITLTHGICGDNPYKGAADNFAMGDITFEAYAVDGTTDPLSYAVAS